MRVTSALFVSALLRRSFGEGAPAAVVRRGSAEAGAIFVIVDRLDGTVDLYGPAPQALLDREIDDRQFQRLLTGVSSEDADRRLEKERRFDPDVFVVAIEDRGGRSFLDLARE